MAAVGIGHANAIFGSFGTLWQFTTNYIRSFENIKFENFYGKKLIFQTV